MGFGSFLCDCYTQRMLNLLRKAIPNTHPLRLFYHKFRGVLAALIYWFPASKLIVIGVTGTNGKTTTVNLVTGILESAGHKVGMTSTINFQVGARRWVNDTKMTNLSPFKMQKLLRQMRKEGCEYAVLEVSSHSVTQSRIYGINFDLALVTNVTPEHIEYHGSFDSYLHAKGGLFRKVSKGRRKAGVPKVLISNADDESYEYFGKFVADKKMSYGMEGAMVHAENLVQKSEGSDFTISVPNAKMDINLKIPGEFNVYNALAAASVALALGVTPDEIRKGLNLVKGVPGRYEHVDKGQSFTVIVDYAHTPEALESLLELYKRLSKGRLIAVFGATGGGRDKTKRPKMGAIAHEHADYIVLTNDDPYEEDYETIIENIARGIPRAENEGLWKIVDRGEAIRHALNLAESEDIVVVAGKGAEETIMLKEGVVKWNDRLFIEGVLDEILKGNDE